MEVTYRTNKDLVALLEVYRAIVIGQGNVGLSLTVGTQVTIQADRLQAVTRQLVISIQSVLLGQLVDRSQMMLALSQVEVDDLSELRESVCLP